MTNDIPEYDIGPDGLDCDEELAGGSYRWAVCHYTNGGYEGHGYMVAMGTDGRLYVWNLSHCSCYGPLDDGPTITTVSEYLKPDETIFTDPAEDALKAKVAELLLAEQGGE